MDEQELFDALVDDRARRLAGARYLSKLACGTGPMAKKKLGTIIKYSKTKTSGLKDLVSKNPVITGAIAGAAAITAAQALANTRFGGTSSLQQRMAASSLRDAEAEAKETRRAGKEPGFLQETRRISAKPVKEFADLAAKHPIKSALTVAPAGAALGATAVRAFRR